MVLMIIMYYMLYGAGSKSHQQTQIIACQKNLQHLHVALKIYAMENKGQYPAVAGATASEIPLSLLVPRCTTQTELFMCLGSGASPPPAARPFPNARISYAYYMGLTTNAAANQMLLSDAQIDTLSKTNGQTVFSLKGKKPGGNHHKYGGNFLYCDGHMQTSSSKLEFDAPVAEGVILLNPKPYLSDPARCCWCKTKA